jgi:hypothetical protein
MPSPHLLYAQVVKSYRRRRIIGVQHRVVFGTREAIDQILAKRGWTINTAFIERLNLDFRQHVAAIGRRVNTLCKREAGYVSNWLSFRCTIILCCHTPAYGCHCHCPSPPMGWAPSNSGSHGHPQWPPA